MVTKKIIVFDMDGTIADLYHVRDWESRLDAKDPSVYTDAEPIYDMDSLTGLLEMLKACGWMIVVTTWMAKNATPDYAAEIRKAKKDWLDKYDFPYDELHVVKYGATKADSTRRHKGHQILVDDNEKVRRGWNLGETIDARKDILKPLIDYLFED